MKRKRPGVLRTVLPHLILVMSGMMVTFFIIDRVNEAMAFLNNDITKVLLLIFSVASATLAVLEIVRQEKMRKEERSEREKGPKGDANEEK